MSGQTLTAQAVAELIGGRLSGDREVVVRRVRSLERAGTGDLAVCSTKRYLAAMATTGASAVLLIPSCADAPGPATRIVVDEPMRAVMVIARHLEGDLDDPIGVDTSARLGTGVRIGQGVCIRAGAVIGRDVEIGDGSVIGPLVVIEDGVRLGRDVRLEARVVLHRGTVLGDRVHCKAGAVIGGTGFGFLTSAEGATTGSPSLVAASSRTTWRSEPTAASTGDRSTTR